MRKYRVTIIKLAARSHSILNSSGITIMPSEQTVAPATTFIHSKLYPKVSLSARIALGLFHTTGAMEMARIERGPYRTIWQDFDDLMAEMESRFQSLLEGIGIRGEEIRGRVVPAVRDFRVDVRDHEDEVIVVADLPGVEKEDVTVRLTDPRHLEIRSQRAGESTEEAPDFFMRERVYGEMSRTVMLPAEVTEEGATASFKNGVLEVRLKKVPIEVGVTIPVE
jgi:HSP20 family protein